MNIDEITCDWFEARLSAYLEDDLDGETRADMDKHVIACDACNALVMDLRASSVDARVLPDLVPPHDLWDGIAARIEAPVIGIESRSGAAARRFVSPRFRDARFWMGAAAAGLVALTAGVTYLATKHAYGGASIQVATTSSSGGGSPSRDRSDSMGASLVAGTTPATAATQPGAGSGLESMAPAAQVRSVAATKTTVEQTYDLEIARLRGIVNTRRSRLDPYTVSVIERSLSVIDQAIAESRAALAKDPASGFLSEQLNSALDKKVQLLRTAAMLPART